MLAILLMLIVPFQFAWSAVESMDGHLDHEGSASVFHYHDDDHHHDGDVDHHDEMAGGLAEQGHNDDGHHDGHFHPVLNIIVFEPQLNLGKALPHDPPMRPPSSFTSHIPSLFDWPPSVLL
ncbi:MAG: hypothetical protein CVU33_07235 [Betaproteobacteria bacterium HGW-Betaproteobacteria-6]|jgi:hypothetical protein|nr:MAG: hypothetical protein CVU33_07235 [Betaproteobacteria bacterium HGW-Betaproteobacteria-6]